MSLNKIKDQYDKILLDFMAESRRTIEKKTFNITIQLKDLKEENERIILKYCKLFQSNDNIITFPPHECTSKKLNSSISNLSIRHSATPKGRNVKHSNCNRKSNTNSNSHNHSKAVIMTKSNSSIQNLKKGYYNNSNKNVSKDNRRIEVVKKPMTNHISRDQNSTVNSAYRNTETSFNGYDKTTMNNNKSLLMKNAMNSIDKARLSIKGNNNSNNNCSCPKKHSSHDMTSKDKAIQVLLNSQVLFIKEKMFFWYTTPILQPTITKKKIFDDYKSLIQSKANDYKRKTVFKSSAIATNCLNFIKNSDEEELMLLGKKASPADLVSLTGEFRLIYAFLGIDPMKMNINEMIVHLYDKVMKDHKISSIKQLIFTVICSNVNRNTVDKHLIENLIKQYDSLFHSVYYLQVSRAASFLNYIMKELANFVMNYDYNTKQYVIYQDIIAKIDKVKL